MKTVIINNFFIALWIFALIYAIIKEDSRANEQRGGLD
jgi:hypothetical protein